MLTIPAAALAFVVLAHAQSAPGPWRGDAARGETFVRVEIELPGGPLPFVVATGPGGSAIVNGPERLGVDLAREGGRSIIDFPHYDSTITIEPGGREGRTGTWRKQRRSSVAMIPVTAAPARGAHDRFDPVPDAGTPGDFAGRWRVAFDQTEGAAVGVFEVDADGLARGTFLTTTGDYRHLEGRVDGPLMRLSAFDGSHAFLFHARLRDDATIAGEFWSGDWWHETWTGARDPDATIPDAFDAAVVSDPAALAALAFPGLDGRTRTVAELLDEQGGAARIVEVFGTWCPNCADAARDLGDLRREFPGLAVVGLAFEYADDRERSARQVARYRERHGADWPVLIAGVSDKAQAAEALPFLDRLRAYPTTFFLDRDNRVVAVHSGYSGPATGAAYERQQQRYREIIRGLREE